MRRPSLAAVAAPKAAIGAWGDPHAEAFLPARTRRRPFLALLLWLFAALVPGMAGSAMAAPGRPLPADQAFSLRVARPAAGAMRIDWAIAPGYYLYRDAIKLMSGGQALQPALEGQAIAKDDHTYGQTTIFEGRLTARLTDTPSQGELLVTFQGCQDAGICYPPVTRKIDLATLVVQGSGRAPVIAEWSAGFAGKAPPAQASPRVGAVSSAAPAAGGMTGKVGGIALAEDDAGIVAPLLEKGGVPLVLGSFLLFGLALAFTPCVFPMYPILAGALARAGSRLTPLRGFTLSLVYVLAMAASFGLLGIVAAFSGKNLQVVLQAPAAIAATSALFAMLALSMFGLFELSLPSSWINALGRGGGTSRGSLASTALLGFTSALIVGPCVTAPLAGALLYIAQTGNMPLGAGALFALGIGKGIPLMIFGTVGQRALPKAGPWMNAVKNGFGVIFLGAAVWIVSRIIPAPAALALWAMLAIGIGVWLGALDAMATGSSGLRRTGKAIGIAALVYGVLLAIGAASGAGDPLRPLERLTAGLPLASPSADSAFSTANDLAGLERHLALAAGRPSLIYLTADWCLTCRTIDRAALADPRVRSGLAGFNLVKLDVSDNSDGERQAMEALRAFGPPTMIFVDADAREKTGTRLTGDISADAILASAGLVLTAR